MPFSSHFCWCPTKELRSWPFDPFLILANGSICFLYIFLCCLERLREMTCTPSYAPYCRKTPDSWISSQDVRRTHREPVKDVAALPCNEHSTGAAEKFKGVCVCVRVCVCVCVWQLSRKWAPGQQTSAPLMSQSIISSGVRLNGLNAKHVSGYGLETNVNVNDGWRLRWQISVGGGCPFCCRGFVVYYIYFVGDTGSVKLNSSAFIHHVVDSHSSVDIWCINMNDIIIYTCYYNTVQQHQKLLLLMEICEYVTWFKKIPTQWYLEKNKSFHCTRESGTEIWCRDL